MTNPNLGKQGIPVLASLTLEPLSLPCSMRIFYNQPYKQLTIALRTSIALQGYTGQQTFIAQYDADNLLPATTTTVDSATVHLRDDRRSTIVRNVDPQITTLTLSVRQPCPLWCPRLEILASQAEPKSVASFNELVALAKATTVHIVFDYKWLHRDTQSAFQRLVKGKERLIGYPLERHYAKPLIRKDWTVFGPIDTAIALSSSSQKTHKRPRQGKFNMIVPY